MNRPITHLISRSVALLITVIIMCGCSQPHKLRIGISQCSDDDWRDKMNSEIMREAMLHDNVEIEIRSADESNDKQIADLDYFVDNNFDIIVVAPNEAEALTPKIKAIYESGIPVIMFDRTINGDYYTAFQGANNEGIGRMAAMLVPTLSDNPRILEITGRIGSTPADYRRSGFRQAADSLGFTVLGEGVGNWNNHEGRLAADSLLDLYPQANIIYAHNDRMAIAAKQAAMARGRSDIKIIGVDAAPAIGIKAVQDGLIDATFLYPTYGDRLIKTALAILEGKPFERELILPTPAPVDLTNAQILLMQDQVLRNETEKIGILQGRMDNFSKKYATQATILYGVIVILLLLAAMIFLLMRYYWSSKRHHQQMQERNETLSRQRDELDNLYHKLEEATSSKLSWFTNVSHDLRTPLTLIADPVHQLAQADNLTPTQHTQMQLADKNVKRLQRLVNQILDIRKFDNEQLRLNMANVNLSESVSSWVASFRDLAVKRHITLVADINPDPIITALDIEKTERIFFNLISNAFKFTPENGSITVSLERRGDNAVMRVADTGRGIPEEDIHHIFERFFHTETVNPNGSGIGLALSKLFIEMQGGSISVKSCVGEGSEFTLTLPLRHVDGQEAVSAPSTIDTSEIEDVEDDAIEVADDASVVLIIDDNPDICTLVKTILADHFTVVAASSGAQGIRLANKLLPDLIISDVMMPGTNGYQVCRALKQDTLTGHIPVLLLTACTHDEQRTEGYECGADAYMSKPFDSDMLLARCKSLIANRKLIFATQEQTPSSPRESAEKAPSQRSAAVHDEFMQRFVSFIEDNISNPELSVESLADSLGISRVQLYRKVKSTTNYSVAEMIRNIRLKRAAKMLKTTEATVSEVAYAVGFSSPSYFSRCYKEYFNESPIDTQNRTSKRH